jgi:hypothetical protein
MNEIIIFLIGVFFGGLLGATFGAFLYAKALYVEWEK